MMPDEFIRFLHDTFASYRRVIKPGASVYVCHASSVQREFQDALEAAGFEVRCQIIWAKNTFAWGFGRYKFQHEPIFYCHVAGQSDPWYGDKTPIYALAGEEAGGQPAAPHHEADRTDRAGAAEQQ